MKCTYEIEVRAQCPVEPNFTDMYKFTIETETMIEVEKIIAFFAANAGKKETFQEALTQHCAVTLGAVVVSVGWHSGVKVTCSSAYEQALRRGGEKNGIRRSIIGKPWYAGV